MKRQATSVKTQPARGERDLLPIDASRREYAAGIIKAACERYGFEPLETPADEKIATLSGRSGAEGEQLIFQARKGGGHESTGEAGLALRCEAELCAAAADALSALGFTNFTIRLSHRQALTGVLDAAGIVAGQHGAALDALERLDEIGLEGVAGELRERGVAAEACERLLSFFQNLAALEHAAEITADEITTTPAALNAAVLGRLVEFVGDHEMGARGIDELRSIAQSATESSAGAKLKIDPSLAPGPSCCTGAMMEINVPDMSGSLGGGGRCDNAAGMFSGRDVPACVFSLNLERIILLMAEREMFPESLAGAE